MLAQAAKARRLVKKATKARTAPAMPHTTTARSETVLAAVLFLGVQAPARACLQPRLAVSWIRHRVAGRSSRELRRQRRSWCAAGGVGRLAASEKVENAVKVVGGVELYLYAAAILSHDEPDSGAEDLAQARFDLDDVWVRLVRGCFT